MPKVLIVDDQPENLKLLANVLSKYNIDVEFALNGTNALSFIENDTFDLVLLDIMMPEMDGFEVCRRIRTGIHNKQVPVIFLTALNDVDTIVKAFQAGAQDYISKPFNQPELLARVNVQLDLKLANDKLYNLNQHLEEQVRLRTLELEKANNELMSLDNAKTEFLNTVSNDIRNPLNNILDIVHLLKDFVDSKTIFHLITNLDKSVKKLEAYSGMAILISELRTNKYQGQFTKVLASEFIDFCFEDLITEIMAKNITLRKPEVNNQIALMADTDLLLKGTRILLDLLISGLDSAGKIDVDVKQNRDIILIKVEKSQSDGQTITHSSVNSEERLEFTFMQLILDYHRGKFEVLENQDGFAGFTMQLPVK